jgi:hypothetical protein
MLQLQIPIVIMPCVDTTNSTITNSQPVNSQPSMPMSLETDYIIETQQPMPMHEKYIVVFNYEVNADAKTRRLNALPGFRSKHVMNRAINGCAATINKGLMSQLLDDPDILFMEKDTLLYETCFSKEPFTDNTMTSAALWHHTMTNTVPVTSDNFSNIHCYILDSGILPTHTEFSTGQVVLAFNAITKTTNAQDDNGHGTAVAAVVGGKTCGIANKTTLHSIKVLDSTGSGYTSDIIAGLNWVLANKKSPSIINLSLGGSFSSSLNTAVQNCINNGIPVICASGNSGIDASTLSPANAAGAITVSAYDSMKTRPSWSNYGSVVSSFAPGVSIRSAWGDSINSYYLVSGTSFAAPIIMGIVARYLKENPTATNSQVLSFLSRANVSNEIVNPGSLTTPNKRLVWNITKVPEC